MKSKHKDLESYLSKTCLLFNFNMVIIKQYKVKKII